MALTKVTDSIIDFDTLTIAGTQAADTTYLKLQNTPATAATHKVAMEFWGNEGTANGSTFNMGRIYGEFDGSSYSTTRLTLGSASGNGTFNDEISLKNGRAGINQTSPFSRLHVSETSWSSGSPYGTVATIEGNNVNDNNWGHLIVTDTTTSTGNGGSIRFAIGDTSALNPFAGIQGVSEGSSYGGLSFYTRPSGGTATERMSITSGGEIFMRQTSATTDGGQLQLSSAGDLYSMYVQNTGFASVGSIKAVERGATSAYSFAQWYSGRRSDTGGGDREFNFRGDGNAYADGSFNNSGADYAEYFESHTGSAIPRGTSVVLENNKVRAATSEDDVADIIGVVRPKEFGKNSMVIGNTAWNMWSEKYLTDDFNCYVMEDYSVVSWNDEDGELVTYESDNIPSDITVPDDAETNTHDENGVKFQRRALNPDFDASLTYEPREERDEWVIVGLIGQVQILDGQPTNDRWIKMRDISDTVEEWYIR